MPRAAAAAAQPCPAHPAPTPHLVPHAGQHLWLHAVVEEAGVQVVVLVLEDARGEAAARVGRRVGCRAGRAGRAARQRAAPVLGQLRAGAPLEHERRLRRQRPRQRA